MAVWLPVLGSVLVAVIASATTVFGIWYTKRLKDSEGRERSPYRVRVVDGLGWVSIAAAVVVAVVVGLLMRTPMAWSIGGAVVAGCAAVVVWSGLRRMPLLSLEARAWLESWLEASHSERKQRRGGLSYRDRAMDMTERTYTEQGLSRVEDAYAEAESDEVQAEVLSPGQLLSQGFHVLISGDAGVGKSTNIRQFDSDVVLRFWAEATRMSVSRDAPIPGLVPVLISARDLVGKSAVEEALRQAPKGMLTRPPARKAAWLVLVDAVDEVLNDEQRQQVWQLLLGAIRTDGSRRFVITSRSVESALRRELGFHRVRHYELHPFTDDQLTEFVVRHQSYSSKRANAQNEAMRARGVRFIAMVRQRGLIDVIRLPLLAKLAADMFFDHHGRDLPMRRVDLYQHSIDLWLGKFDDTLKYEVLHDVPEDEQDEVRKLLHRLDERYATAASRGDRVQVLKRFLSVLAFGYTSGDEAGTGRYLVDFATELLGTEDTARIPSTRLAIGRILEATGLVQDPYHEARFWHQTFAEYLSATLPGDVVSDAGPDIWRRRLKDPATRAGMVFIFHHLSTAQKSRVITELIDSPEDLLYAAMIAAEDICNAEQAEPIMDAVWKIRPAIPLSEDRSHDEEAQWWRIVDLLAGHSTLNRRLAALCDDPATTLLDRINLAEILANHGDEKRRAQFEDLVYKNR